MDDKHPILAGRFELVAVVGRGGMGTVYRATDLVLGRTVAVKVLAAALLEDPVHVARFEREARAAASLAHPAVVAVYDTGVDHGAHFIVMEFVSGRSLAELIGDRGRFDADRAAGIAARVADALRAAHAAGLVHRDIKPANVMLTDDGGVKVLDFGIARALDGTALTQTASVLGTAAYMAPEQALGDPADERSDIYSLGCLLYALLAGRPPFAGQLPAAITHQHVHADPLPLRGAGARLPDALDQLVMQMLAKLPDARPQSAAEVRDRLDLTLAKPPAWSAPPAHAGRPGPDSATVASPRLSVVPRVPRMAEAADGPDGDRGAPAPQARRRRARSAALACAGIALAALVLILADRPSGRSGSQATRSSPAASTGSATTSTDPSTVASTTTTTQATTTSPPPASTTPTAPTQTAPASAASGAGAAAALTGVIGQAEQAGVISGPAATQLTDAVTGVVAALAAGQAKDVQHKLDDLVRRAAELERQGEVSPAGALVLNAALRAVASAVGSAAGPAAGPVAGPAGSGADAPGGRGDAHARGPFGRGHSFRP